MQTQQRPTSSLAQWLDDLLVKYRTDRSDEETAMERNLKLFRGKDVSKWKLGEGEDWRCKVHIRTAKQKVWSALSTIFDVLIRNGEVPFSLVKSPYSPPEQEQNQPEEQVTAAIEDFTDAIKQDHRDRKADREMRKKLLSMAVYGKCYSRFDVKDIDRMAYVPVDYSAEDPGVEGMEAVDAVNDEPVIRWEMSEWKDSVAGHSYVSPWAIFTDLENSDLQKNQGTFEVDAISPYDLTELTSQPPNSGYIKDEIESLIDELEKDATAPVGDQTHLPPHQRTQVASRFRYEPRAVFWGRVPRSYVKDFMSRVKAGTLSDDVVDLGDGDDPVQLEVRAELCRGRVIYFRLNPGAKRPYKCCPWEEGLDGDRAQGVVENIEELVTLLNGIVRAFMDNKSLSANVMLAVKKRLLAPGALDSFTPGKSIDVSEAAKTVAEAMQQIVIQDVGESLLSAFGITNQVIDDVSQVPKIMQGSVLAKQKSDTAYEMAQLLENAGKYLGMVIANIDDYLIEPEVMDLYHYHMADPDYQGAKASLICHANGSVALQNRLLRIEKLMQLLSLLLSSELLAGEAKLRPHLEEIYKAQDLDPETYLKTEEEKLAEQQQMAEMQAQAEAKVMQQMAHQAQMAAQIEMGQESHKSQLDMEEQTHKIKTEIVKELTLADTKEGE